MCVPPGLCAHVRWARFLVWGLWSRRLTEPPRPMRRGERTPPPACGGHLPFQGRRCSGSLQKFPSAEGAFWIAHTSLNVSQRWQVAAALSAAVTTTKLIGDAPTFQAEPSKGKGVRQTPAALRGEGVWGRGASLREAASPPESPLSIAFSGGSAREGAFLKKSPLPRISHLVHNAFSRQARHRAMCSVSHSSASASARCMLNSSAKLRLSRAAAIASAVTRPALAATCSK